MNSLYQFPKQALFGRVLPKNKIYEHTKPSIALREKFVKQIDKIIWQYKLAPETVNLTATAQVPEIQIFLITIRTSELDEGVLRCIDEAIPFPVFYHLIYETKIKVKVAHKRPSEVDSSKWVVGPYFETPWQCSDCERVPLPISLNLSGLYEQMMRCYLPFPARAGESLQTQIYRLCLIHEKTNEIKKLELRLRAEKQFNRKVKLNMELRRIIEYVEILSI